MRRILRTGLAVALLAGALTVTGGAASVASAADVAAAPGQTRSCSAAEPKTPCIKWCYFIPERPQDGAYPCGVGRVPTLTGRYTFTVPMSAATQTATGVAGDPGATGSTSVTLDLTNNRFCATTSWSGIDSPVAAGHIHQGAYGRPENPAVTISLFAANFVNGVQSGVSYCETVPAAELWLIKECPREFNTVVHSRSHPVGAIRGQLGTACNL